MPERYSLPAHLVQGIFAILNELPARMSRQLLNTMEAECLAQEQPAGAVQASAPVPDQGAAS